jgi:hypothetical protein
MKSETFRMGRFLRLLQLELRLNAGGIGYGAAALFCVLMARWMLSGFMFRDRFIAVDYGFFLLTGGLVLASLSFSDMADPVRAQAFLMLPASRLEKYLSRYMQTSWLVAAGGLAVYVIFLGVTAVLHAAFPLHAAVPIHPFQSTLPDAIVYFLVLHAVFFLGSLVFPKWAFLKTIVAIAAFSLLLWLFASGFSRLLFRHEFFAPCEEVMLFSEKIRLYPAFLGWSLLIPFEWIWTDWGWMFFKWSPFWILPPLFLWAGYHRFGEIEQTHGIS